MLRQLLVLLVVASKKANALVSPRKMSHLHARLNESIRFFHKSPSSSGWHQKRNNPHQAYIKQPLFHIHQRKINYLKNGSGIYSKYYNNEPVYNTYNPILNYEVLDLVKVFGRLAEHGQYESFNIAVDVGVNEEERLNGPDGQHGQTKRNTSWLYKILAILKFKNLYEHHKRGHWYWHFSQHGKMNFADFKKHLFLLKFKWPKDSLFPTYNIFLFERGLSKNADSPLIRSKVENYIQRQEINENLLKSCFFCFSEGKEYITARDILNTFLGWKKKGDKNERKERDTNFFSFFKKATPEEDSIDWFTFKNKIDACTIRMHEGKK
ncbi:conserved Plasmodium protein, unknown function [Plasmodium vivax]|uniref:Uncharacterized protein n=6 Tax=Plasmodium vivax TaxID=5855 RepID=A5K0F2_PLAVS|nr:hypothetical protein, conserved [Plasmodium vivax]KMZ78398.1 hypothetical protein PVIIG_01176 [Plasmodium vivax India VII]KMZ83586.1 hypothetical protein PVBG_00666 [Plasmodium vivax Brazil I]KMZ91034.1 hypothetical protein PVMG_05863 [Plasmodium vivax Mauritania I]KMZ97571.1 hypothetical protein PVNG_01308 [Plasmodium vivax North Korean]EDL46799.1 hypothetical protein, conserved [Plasmodium vivax]|eukprot:XP_001616526.1 hypothetical protein [Plasmodium vivax Sal-1]